MHDQEKAQKRCEQTFTPPIDPQHIKSLHQPMKQNPEEITKIANPEEGRESDFLISRLSPFSDSKVQSSTEKKKKKTHRTHKETGNGPFKRKNKATE